MEEILQIPGVCDEKNPYGRFDLSLLVTLSR